MQAERSKVERNKILEAFLKALGHKFISVITDKSQLINYYSI